MKIYIVTDEDNKIHIVTREKHIAESFINSLPNTAKWLDMKITEHILDFIPPTTECLVYKVVFDRGHGIRVDTCPLWQLIEDPNKYPRTLQTHRDTIIAYSIVSVDEAVELGQKTALLEWGNNWREETTKPYNLSPKGKPMIIRGLKWL